MINLKKALDYDKRITLSDAFREGFNMALSLNQPEYEAIELIDMWGVMLLESMEVVNVEGHQYEMFLNFLIMLGVGI